MLASHLHWFLIVCECLTFPLCTSAFVVCGTWSSEGNVILVHLWKLNYWLLLSLRTQLPFVATHFVWPLMDWYQLLAGRVWKSRGNATPFWVTVIVYKTNDTDVFLSRFNWSTDMLSTRTETVSLVFLQHLLQLVLLADCPVSSVRHQRMINMLPFRNPGLFIDGSLPLQQ